VRTDCSQHVRPSGPGPRPSRGYRRLIADQTCIRLPCSDVEFVHATELDTLIERGGGKPAHLDARLACELRHLGCEATSSYRFGGPTGTSFAPGALEFAARLLRRGRELLERHRFHRDEVENSLVRARPVPPEAMDLLAVIAHDAGRIAEMLWSGNRRSGRSLRDVESVIAGKESDVPPDEDPLALIVADDQDFERKLTSLLSNTQPNGEDSGCRGTARVNFGR
jgi:hypothetical protein